MMWAQPTCLPPPCVLLANSSESIRGSSPPAVHIATALASVVSVTMDHPRSHWHVLNNPSYTVPL